MKKLLFILSASVTLAVCAITYGKSESLATRYIKDRVRIVAQDTTSITGSVITVYRQGKKCWSTTNAVKVINRPIERPTKYSKLKLIVAAKQAGKWGDVKAAIAQMGLEDEWNACQYVTSDYPAYISATNAVIQNGIATEAEVKAFMALAEDN